MRLPGFSRPSGLRMVFQPRIKFSVAGSLLMQLLIAPLPLPAAAADTDGIPPIPAGRYEILSTMHMPHMDKMRRHEDHQTVCVSGGDAAALFPVMRHNAFDGCALRQENHKDDRYYYRIDCGSRLQATGTAVLDTGRKPLEGEIKATMGGKNMTLSQHIRASYQGACDAVDRTTHPAAETDDS